MHRLSFRLASIIVHRRWLVIALLSIVTCISIVGHWNPQLVWSLFEAPAETEQQQETTESTRSPSSTVSPISLSYADAVLVIESEDFFNPRSVAALRKIASDLESLDQVRSVLWLDRVPVLNIFGLPEPLLPQASASSGRYAAAQKKSLEHPLVKGQLLSSDGRALLMLITLDYYHIHDDSDATELLKQTAIESLKDDSSETYRESNVPDFQIRLTGRMPSAIAALQAHESNLLQFQIIGYGMTFVMALILFRGIRAVMIVALAPVVGVFWTLGIIRFFDYTQNPLIDVIVPILVSLVGLTDGVHLMVQIRKLRSSGMDQTGAAARGLGQVGLACFLTSLTTAIGLGSLMLAESVWVQQFGQCSMIGVGLCFVSVVTVIPLASTTWLGRSVHIGQEKSPVEKGLQRIGGLVEFVLIRRKLVSFVALICCLTTIGMATGLRPDQRQSDNLPPTAEATEALKFMDQKFGGLEFSQVDISWTDSVERNSPDILKVVSAVDALLTAESMLGHPLSIKNLIDAQPGSGPAEERMSMVELLPPPLKLAFYNPDRNSATINFRVQDLGIAAYSEVFEQLEKDLVAIQEQHPGFTLSLSGDAVWRWRNLYQIVIDLATSLGTASLIIWLVLTIVFRSVRLGLISIVPNLFPLAFTGAVLWLADYRLEIVMVCNFTVCLGIAVDDTIHFLTRYIEERSQVDDTDLAIKRAFTGVGSALIMTTAVLVAGFGIVTLSDSREHFIFAMMGALTISAALFCDLIFLPALLSVFAGAQDRKLKPTDGTVAS